MVLRVARDVSTFVEPEPTAVFVCHLCPFRAEPRARANDPPSFTASITTRNVSLGNAVPSSRAKAATQTVSRISTGPTNGNTTLLIHWDGTGPPRCFSRIRLGRQEFATLFRHGLLFQSTFEALVSREQQPALFLPRRFLLRSFFDGRSQERLRCLQCSFEQFGPVDRCFRWFHMVDGRVINYSQAIVGKKKHLGFRRSKYFHPSRLCDSQRSIPRFLG